MLTFLKPLADYPIITVFLLANLGIGVWAYMKSKTHSFTDYAIANRSLPTAVLVMTLLGTLLNGGYLAHPDGVYARGIVTAMQLLATVAAFLLIGSFIAPRLVYFEGCLTLGGLMSKMYGRAGRILTGIISVLFSFLMVAKQTQTVTSLAEDILGIPILYSAVMFGGLIVLYSVFGGMRSVSYTDVLQVLLGLLALTWIAQALLRETGGFSLLWDTLQTKHASKMKIVSSSSFVEGVKSMFFWRLSFVWILTPPVMQRMLAVQDKKSVRRMWYTGALLIGSIMAINALIGVIGIANSHTFFAAGKPKNMLTFFVKTLFAKQSAIVQVLFIGLLAFPISTMDSFLHSASLSFVQDVINPIRLLTGKRELGVKQKTIFARVGVLFLGILAIMLGAQHSVIADRRLSSAIICIYTIIIIPLIIGLLGIKTDKMSWGGFAGAYTGSVIILSILRRPSYDTFLLSLAIGILAYFVTHLAINGGFVTVQRRRHTTAERLWVPSWTGVRKGVTQWINATFNLPQLARVEASRGNPVQPLGFSVFMFGLYVLSSVVGAEKGDAGVPQFMAGIRGIGIALCCGLMLEGVWPRRLKYYFPLYWFTTLFYCLPLGGTIAFLRMHEGMGSFVFFVGSFGLLSWLVSSRAFFWMSVCGLCFAHLGWRIVAGSMPQGLWEDSNYMLGSFVVGALILCVISFLRRKEEKAENELYTAKALARAMPHEARNVMNDMGSVSFFLDRVDKEFVPTKNKAGEKGFFLPEEMRQYVVEAGDKVDESTDQVNLEFSRFKKMIKEDINTAHQEKVSLKAIIEETLPKIPKQYREEVQVTVKCLQDFEAYMLSDFFGNVLTNIVKNAKNHGKANQLEITIDGHHRQVYMRDNGNGIPQDSLSRIFDLGYTTGKHEDSEGVGLALIKLILNASDIHIYCHSRHGDKDAFTEFVLAFPLLEKD